MPMNKQKRMREDEHIDSLAALAFARDADSEIEELLAQEELPEVDEFQRLRAWGNFEDLQDEIERRERKIRLHKTLLRLGKQAACILIALGIAIGSASALDDLFYKSVTINTLVMEEDKAGDMNFHFKTEVIEYPSWWTGVLYPAELPEGTRLKRLKGYDPKQPDMWFRFSNSAGPLQDLHLYQFDNSADFSIDVTETTIAEEQINDWDVKIFTSPYMRTAVWQVDDCMYVAQTSSLPRAELIEFIQSLRKIQ